MRKFFSGLLLLVFLFSAGTVSANSILRIGESLLTKPGSTETAYVDYLVTDYSLMDHNSSFVFASTTYPSDPWFPSGVVGSQTAYDNSQFFYYYQLENTSTSNLDLLTLYLEPAFIASIGYIMGADLDDVNTFNHNNGVSSLVETLSGDHENDGASIDNADSADFDTFDSTPNQTWDFDPAMLGRDKFESCVLFVTSSRGPIDSTIYSRNGGSWSGEAPTPPTAAIPEPFSMILLGSGLVGLLIRRRK